MAKESDEIEEILRQRLEKEKRLKACAEIRAYGTCAMLNTHSGDCNIAIGYCGATYNPPEPNNMYACLYSPPPKNYQSYQQMQVNEMTKREKQNYEQQIETLVRRIKYLEEENAQYKAKDFKRKSRTELFNNIKSEIKKAFDSIVKWFNT